MRRTKIALAVLLATVLAGCVTTRESQPATVTRDDRVFVAAANPVAVEAGLAVLRRGGSAVDAAVAMQAMLSLVEPQSSGIGGGAFMIYLDAATSRITLYDGRETAPAGATADMFLGADGKPMPFNEAVLSGRATGVPGAVRLLGLAHDEHGRLPWRTLFGDAGRVARDGFIVSPRLGRFLAGKFAENDAPDVRTYFTGPDGKLVRTGDRLRNPAYAEFLGRLARQGMAALYAGPTAARIVARTHAEPLAGTMTLADLAGYRPVKRDPLCGHYRVYLVCVPPPPSSGVALLQLLAMLERTDIATRGPQDPQAWFLFAEASRLMYADRDRYVGDPAFVKVPVAGLLDPAYVASRAALIGTSAAPAPAAGMPPGATLAAIDATVEPTGTSHFIVRDAAGNVVSMTTTVESIFGTGRMVDGFFLNNQLTDFSFAPRDAQGRPIANAAAPGKRPRSSMTPLIMLDADGRFAGALGSAGGSAILAYVGKSMVGAIDWKLPMQDALALPNLVATGGNFFGEVTKFSPGLQAALAARGITLRPGQGEDSGLQGLIVRDGAFDGGYDPRREGQAITERVMRRR
ncbi:gamma-glutamyltransferase family protein [uncultured Sphingomonas sp.]|uniref:gamma-glutamyltransferase family protein n=1 Tax=uncultured Sphingomonas sp. TaxID=158754 RepID=UPI0035CC1195